MCERRKLLMMKELLHTFFQHYLEDRNLNATLAMLSDQIVSIGTGEQEIARNKEELADLLKKEFQDSRVNVVGTVETPVPGNSCWF